MAVTDDDFGNTDLVELDIKLVEGARLHWAKLQPLNPLQREDLERQLESWLSQGVITPVVSEWSAALVPCEEEGNRQVAVGGRLSQTQ